jgi:NAD(P)-dependent dehydrogenase (short-subunit alcohol dehydrogenase family)
MSKTVFISGASSGIGAATGEFFLKKGWQVAASMRNPEKAPSWTRHAECLVVRLDVTDNESIKTAIAAAVERFGTIDVLINNAGYALNGPLEGFDAEALKRQFDTNVLGLIEVSRAVLPLMRAKHSGTIVNVSSIGGRIGFPFASPYNATKFAVEGLSESLRFELGLHGIRVKLVEPGGIKTDFYSRSIEWSAHAAYEPQLSKFKAMGERMIAGLPGPEEVAQVVYRASTDSGTRLRYLAKPGLIFAIRRLLPDALWRRLLETMLSSRSDKSLPGDAKRRA